MNGTDYLSERRLQDVLALIQILGFGAEPDLTPREICVSLQDVGEDGKPVDERLRHWEMVARAHTEFFGYLASRSRYHSSPGLPQAGIRRADSWRPRLFSD